MTIKITILIKVVVDNHKEISLTKISRRNYNSNPKVIIMGMANRQLVLMVIGAAMWFLLNSS